MGAYDWLENLKAGDKVIIDRGRFHFREIAKVERLTKTLVVLENNMRFQRNSGRLRGSDIWSMIYIKEYSIEKGQEIIEEVTVCRKANKFKELPWNKLSAKALLTLEQTIDKAFADINQSQNPE